MATTLGIENISNQAEDITLDVYKTLHRAEAYPLDSTEVFTDKTAAETYAKGEETGNSYQSGSAAYVGQHITVVDNDEAQMYQIRNTAGELAKVITDKIIDAYTKPLAGKKFNLDDKTAAEILSELIKALGGKIEE